MRVSDEQSMQTALPGLRAWEKRAANARRRLQKRLLCCGFIFATGLYLPWKAEVPIVVTQQDAAEPVSMQEPVLPGLAVQSPPSASMLAIDAVTEGAVTTGSISRTETTTASAGRTTPEELNQRPRRSDTTGRAAAVPVEVPPIKKRVSDAQAAGINGSSKASAWSAQFHASDQNGSAAW